VTKHRVHLLLAVALLVLGATSGASAADCESACRQEVWLHRGDAALGNAATPSWSTEKPTASVAAGAGGAYVSARAVDLFVPRNRAARPTFAGAFTGRLDTLAVTLYAVAPTADAVWNELRVVTRLTVDDAVVYDEPSTVVEVPFAPGANRVGTVRFAFTGIAQALEVLDKGNAPDTAHAVTLEVIPRLYTDDAVVLYDAAEVPSGIVFNEQALDRFVRIDAGGSTLAKSPDAPRPVMQRTRGQISRYNEVGLRVEDFVDVTYDRPVVCVGDRARVAAFTYTDADSDAVAASRLECSTSGSTLVTVRFPPGTLTYNDDGELRYDAAEGKPAVRTAGGSAAVSPQTLVVDCCMGVF
jgi:hypothetical protein